MKNTFVTLTQAAHPARIFEDPVLIEGELQRRGNDPVKVTEDAAESGIIDPTLLQDAGPEAGQFDGWADIAHWMGLVEHKDEWAPFLTGFVTCPGQRERLVFRDGNARLLEGHLVYPDARGGGAEVMGPGGGGCNVSTFDYEGWNDCGTLWEVRTPGVEAERAWNDGEHEFDTLDAAVQALLPNHADYGLTVPAAAKLLLELGLVLGTGIEIRDEEE